MVSWCLLWPAWGPFRRTERPEAILVGKEEQGLLSYGAPFFEKLFSWRCSLPLQLGFLKSVKIFSGSLSTGFKSSSSQMNSFITNFLCVCFGSKCCWVNTMNIVVTADVVFCVWCSCCLVAVGPHWFSLSLSIFIVNSVFHICILLQCHFIFCYKLPWVIFVEWRYILYK